MAEIIEINHGPFDEKSKKPHKKQEKEFEQKVVNAFETGDLSALYQMFPEPVDLLKYRASRRSYYAGGSVLHIAANKASHDFLKEFLSDYFPDNSSRENIVIKNKLLNVRNMDDKLATDLALREGKTKKFERKFSKELYFDNVTSPNYQFLKKEILASWPKVTRDDIHHLDPMTDTDKQKKLPVSVSFLTGEKSTWRKNFYPTIRLRNIPKNPDEAETYVEIKNIPITNYDSSYDFLYKAKEQIDFPDDYTKFFGILCSFADNYNYIFRHDPGNLAAYRFFTANNGVVVIEDKNDPYFKDESGYAGYAHTTRGDQPFIVLNNSSANGSEKQTLLHELFHQVDLFTGVIISETDLCKAVFMLSDNHVHKDYNQLIFDYVDERYSKTSDYQSETFAHLMEWSDGIYDQEPLLYRLHKIASKIGIAKADNIPAIENRIAQALVNLPENHELCNLYDDFIALKDLKYKMATNEDEIEYKNKKQAFDNKLEPKRKEYETALVKTMDQLLVDIKKLEKASKEVQQLKLSSDLLSLETPNDTFPIERVLLDRKKNVQMQIIPLADDKDAAIKVLTNKLETVEDPLDFAATKEVILELKKENMQLQIQPFANDKDTAIKVLTNKLETVEDPLDFGAIKEVILELEEKNYFSWGSTNFEREKEAIRKVKEQQELFNNLYPNEDVPKGLQISTDSKGYLTFNDTFTRWLKSPEGINKPNFEVAKVLTVGFKDYTALAFFDNYLSNTCPPSGDVLANLPPLQKTVAKNLAELQMRYKELYGKDVELPRKITLSGLSFSDFKYIYTSIASYQEKLDQEFKKRWEISNLGNVTPNSGAIEQISQSNNSSPSVATLVGTKKDGR